MEIIDKKAFVVRTRDLFVSVPGFGKERVAAVHHNLVTAIDLAFGPEPIFEALAAESGFTDYLWEQS